MATLTFAEGKYTVDSTALPSAIVDRLLQSGFNHVLGNEVASQTVAWIKGEIAGKTEGRQSKDVSKDEVGGYRTSAPHGVAAKEHEFRLAKVAAMLDGSLVVRSGGGGARALDPVERAMRDFAKSEIVAVLAKQNLKFPVGKSESGAPNTIVLAGTAVTGADLIARRIDHPEHGPRIRKLAESKVAADKRLAKQSADAVAGTVDGAALAAELGL